MKHSATAVMKAGRVKLGVGRIKCPGRAQDSPLGMNLIHKQELSQFDNVAANTISYVNSYQRGNRIHSPEAPLRCFHFGFDPREAHFMHGEVHANYVFYRNAPKPGHKFRQITLHELETFIVIVGEGEVIQDAPKFQASNQDAESYICNTLEEALAEVEKERQRAEQEGWLPYRPY